MRKGDLIRWFEYYAEGDIVRDTGLGVIMESDQWRHDETEGIRYSNIVHVIFKVYKFKDGTCEWFADNHVDMISPADRINKTKTNTKT